MAIEAWITTAVFWATFELTPGPFWVAFMQAVRSNSFRVLLKQYALFVLLGSGLQIIFIALFVGKVATLHPWIYTALNFVGAGVVFSMAYQTLSTVHRQQTMDFNWFKMSLISWGSPKAWSVIPVGALNATYTDYVLPNAALFFAVSLPFSIVSVFVWGYLGVLGAKIEIKKFSCATTAVLTGYGVYLLTQGLARVFD